MAYRQVDLAGIKGGYRSKRILALIPRRAHSSDDSGADDSADDESSVLNKKPTNPSIIIQPSDPESSPAPSLCSSLENINMSDSDDDNHSHSSAVIDVNGLVENSDTPSPAAVETIEQEPAQETPIENPTISNENNVETIECVPSVTSHANLAEDPSTPREAPKKIQRKRKAVPTKKTVNTKKKKTKPEPKNFDWKANTKIAFNADTPDIGDKLTVPEKIEDPFKYFTKFFSDDIIQLMFEQTNLYGVQKTGSYPNISAADIKDFLAINILMGVVKLPAYTDYWASETRYDKVANIMPLKKFQKIRRFLHFADNNADDGDRYYKIRPLLIKIRSNCLSIEQEGRYSVDEMMVPYKGTRAGNRRQYIKGKPKKWGFKIFVRAGVSGIVYDFIIYGGDDTFRHNTFTEAEKIMGLGAKVVIALAKSIKNPACSILYFDNFFTSIELISYLREQYGIFTLGTLRNNRLKGAQKFLKSDKHLKKSGRGSYCQVVSSKRKVVVVKWFDSKAIHLASSFVDAYPLDQVLRYNKEVKARSRIQCPQVVKQYNIHMGGVDLADMLIALYRTEFKGHRWYLPIFSQMLDISINNAWLLYRRDNKLLNRKPEYKLKEFRIAIANALIATDRDTNDNAVFKAVKINNPAGPLPTASVRFDCVGHWPGLEKKGRCRFCKSGQTTIFCKKCKVRLCLLEKRNCFEAFHKSS